MKSAKSEQVQVEWLIGEIRELDSMIDMHRTAGSDYMADQYEVRRLNFLKELISLLATSKYNSSTLETFPLINALTRNSFARGLKQGKSVRQVTDPFQRTIDFYRRKAETVYKQAVPAIKSVQEEPPVYKVKKVREK
ncbi:MAG: hypothetical protein IT260_21985 [Saprospiraceae bacterium]|nr:hypothetical protein [Saprospiraceae bacterium]